MENLTEEQKEVLTRTVKALKEKGYSALPYDIKELFPEAFAEPKEQVFKVTVSGGMGDGQMMRMLSENFNFAKFKVIEITDKELPELYTAEDMIEFANYWHDGIGKYDEISESLKYWKEPKK